MAMSGNHEQLKRAEEMRESAERIESLPAQKKLLEVLDKAMEGKDSIERADALDRIQTYMEVVENVESTDLPDFVKRRALKMCAEGIQDLHMDAKDILRVYSYTSKMLKLREESLVYNPDFAPEDLGEDELEEGTLGYRAPNTIYKTVTSPTPGGGTPSATPSAAPETPNFDDIQKELEGLRFSKPAEFDNINTTENQIMNLGRLNHTPQIVGALDTLAQIRAQFTGGEVRPDLIFEFGDKAGKEMSVNKLAKATFGLNEKTLWEVYEAEFPGLKDGDPINNPDKIEGLPKFIQRQYAREERSDRRLENFKGKEGGKKEERLKAKEEKHDQIIRLLQNKDLIEQFMLAVKELSTYMPKAKLVGGQNAKQVERARWNTIEANETSEDPETRKRHAVISEYFNPRHNGPNIKLTPIEWITHMGQWGHSRPSVTSVSIGRETTGIQRFDGYDTAKLKERKKLKKNQEVRARSDYSVYQELMQLSSPEAMVQQLEEWRKLGEIVRKLRAEHSPRMKDDYKLPSRPSAEIKKTLDDAMLADDLTVFDVRLGQNFEQEMKVQRAFVEQTLENGATEASEALIEDQELYTQLTKEIARMENLTPHHRARMKEELQNRMNGFFTLMYGVEDWNTPEGEERKKQLAAYMGAQYELLPGFFLEFGLGHNNLLDARIFKPDEDPAGGFLQTGVEYRFNFGQDNKNELSAGFMLQVQQIPVGNDRAFKPYAQVDYRRYFGEKGWFATAGTTASFLDYSVRAGFGNDRERNLRGNFERWMSGKEGGAKRQRGKGYGIEQWRHFKDEVQALKEDYLAESEDLKLDEIGKVALQNYLYKQMEYDYMVDQFSGWDAMRVGFEAGVVAGVRWENGGTVPVGLYAGVGISNTNLLGHRLSYEEVLHGSGVREKDLSINGETIVSSLKINADSDAGALLDQMNETYEGVVEFTVADAPNDDLVEVRFFNEKSTPINGRVSIITDSKDNLPIIQPDESGHFFYTSLDTNKLPVFNITRVVDQFTGDTHVMIYMSAHEITEEDKLDSERFAGGVSFDANTNGKDAQRFQVYEGDDYESKRSVWASPDAYRSSGRYEEGNLSKKFEGRLEEAYKAERIRLDDIDFSTHPDIAQNRKQLAQTVRTNLEAKHSKLRNRREFRKALSESTAGNDPYGFTVEIESVLGDKASTDTIIYVKQGLLEIQRADEITKEDWCENAMGNMISREFAEAYYDFLITKYEKGEIDKLPTLTADEFMSGETATGVNRDKTTQTTEMVLSNTDWGSLNGGLLHAPIELSGDIEAILTALQIPAGQRDQFRALLESSLKEYVGSRREKIARQNPVENIDAFDASRFNECKNSLVSRIFMESLMKMKEEGKTNSETQKQYAKTLKTLREEGIYVAELINMFTQKDPLTAEQQEKALTYMKMVDKLYSDGEWNSVTLKHAVHAGTLDSCYNPAVLDDLRIEVETSLETHLELREHAYAVDPKAGVNTRTAKVPFMPKPKGKVSGKGEGYRVEGHQEAGDPLYSTSDITN